MIEEVETIVADNNAYLSLGILKHTIEMQEKGLVVEVQYQHSMTQNPNSGKMERYTALIIGRRKEE